MLGGLEYRSFNQGVKRALGSASGSALVGFQRPETGSVLRSVQAELLDGVIKPEQFGAVGDSTGVAGTGTDDAAALNLASNAAAGKTLYFSKKYRIASNVTIGATVNCVFAVGADVIPDAGKSFFTSKNIVVGAYKGASTTWTTGQGNTIMGSEAGKVMTSATECTFIGYLSGSLNTTGNYNTGVGSGACGQVVIGSNLTAVGNNALRICTADSNTSVGKDSLMACTIGTPNDAFGYRALTALIGGANNVSIGSGSGSATTSGGANVFVGSAAGAANTTASNSVFVGTFAGLNATNGNNIFIGSSAGSATTTGQKNILIGVSVQTETVADNFKCVIGSSTSRMDDVYFGKGMADAAPTAYTVHGTAGLGADIAGGDIYIAGGQGTGTGVGGKVKLQTSAAAGSSSVKNALNDVLSCLTTGEIQIHKALVALGGGAAPTLGTIGGTGPAAAAQRGWIRFIESDGTASWLACWR